MRVHIIHHAHFESPGAILEWAQQKGLAVELYHPYRNSEDLPNPSPFDAVISLGGPQSAIDYQNYDFLEKEVALLKTLIAAQHPVLGICLGAQLIAEALGAKTAKSPEKEVGFFAITLTEQGKNHPYFSELPTTFDVFHWHNDMPGIPSGAQVLAHSAGCPRQIVAFSPRVLGFQCHFEATPELINDMLLHAGNDLAASKYTQSAEQLRTSDCKSMNQLLFRILDQWYAHS